MPTKTTSGNIFNDIADNMLDFSRMAAILIITLIIFIAFILHQNGLSTYKYTENDLYINAYTVSEVFDVGSATERKEKDKPTVYDVAFTALRNTGVSDDINARFLFSEQEYENYIGSGNNTISGDVYVLKIATNGLTDEIYRELLEQGDYFYVLSICRYECLGEKPFTEQEIQKITQKACAIFTNVNTSFGTNTDISSLGNITLYNTEKFSFLLDEDGIRDIQTHGPDNFVKFVPL